MIREASAQVESLTSLIDIARELDLHYIPSRYPNGLPGGYPHEFYSSSVAESAYSGAVRLVTAVREFFAYREEVEILRGEPE